MKKKRNKKFVAKLNAEVTGQSTGDDNSNSADTEDRTDGRENR